MFKINNDFVLRRINGHNLVIPTGKRIKDFQGALVLNETGVLIYEQLQHKKTITEIVEILISEYDTNIENAKKDVEKFIELLKEAGVLIE